uniref:ribonuclease III n=1 Tax=Strigamia maritima TaxID=126957 RepID=T1J2F6_STRMM
MTTEYLPPRIRRLPFHDNIHTSIFTPREYQVELLDAARKHNLIMCLGTIPNKVFVSLMLVRELAFEIRRRKREKLKWTVVVFTCGDYKLMKCRITVVHRYANMIRDHIDLNVAEFTRKEHLSVENNLTDNNVLVMTAQIFDHFLQTDKNYLSHINLIILGDSHLLVKHNRDYEKIAKTLRQFEPPLRILGLSANIMQTSCEEPHQLELYMNCLERTVNCRVETSSNMLSLSRFGNQSNEIVVECRKTTSKPKSHDIDAEPDLDTEIRGIVESALAFVSDHVYKPEEIYGSLDEDLNIPDPNIIPKFYLNEILHILSSLGAWCVNRASRRFLRELKKHKDDTPYERHYLLISMVYTIMEVVQAACEYRFRNLTEIEKILNYSSPKILRLLDILIQFKPSTNLKETSETSLPNQAARNCADSKCKNCCCNCENNAKNEEATKQKPGYRRPRYQNSNSGFDDPNALCGLVFVDKRNTACIMHMLLKELSRHDEEYRFLVPNFLVGYNKFPVKQKVPQSGENREVMVEHRKQEEVLRRFRLHECNLLVTTSVLQEGIDIPKCNLVVRFDLPRDYKAYVQCKGRARASKSHFVLLTESCETNGFVDDLARFKTIEEVLLSRCHEREVPTDEESDPKMSDELLPVYRPNDTEGGAKVSMSTAISLVNKYSAKLPSDTFTRLTPLCKMRRMGENEFQAVLFLPINSPIKKPVVGPVMKNEAFAKMAAALNMCKVLHKAGELDDNLFPVGKESVHYEAELMEKWDEESVAEGAPKPGTTKRRQYYYKSTAKAFVNCHPSPKEANYVYVINMKLTCPIPEEQNTRGRRIYAPEETERCFGIVTSKPIPKICGFPVFTRSGEVTVLLEEINSQLLLTNDQLLRLSFFHNYTFSKVLRLEKYPMKYDPTTAESCYFIVPLNKREQSLIVDWDFVDLIYCQQNVKPRLIPECEREKFEFVLPNYEDSVVMPWYRNLDQPQYFYVAEICYTLNPKSDFPDDEFETFENYYFKKYNIQIQRLGQPLLDVDHTSARLNLLTPRYVNRKGVALPTSSEETKRAKRENLQQKQILVPELCTIHPFPASLWRKAVCLPCVLYRANSLLVAEQLRVRVAMEAGLGKKNIAIDYEWPVLDFGWSLADVLRAHAANKEAAIVNNNKNNVKPDVNKPIWENVKPVAPKKTLKQWGTMGGGSAFDIGTWSNDMIEEDDDVETDNRSKVGAFEGDFFDLKNLPANLMMLNSNGFNEEEESELEDIENKKKNDHKPTIRIGSPSNFEDDDGWEFENGEDVDVMNIPGFSFISVSGGAFNLEDLSRDLEAYEEEEESTMQTETFEDDDEKGDYPVVSYWGDSNEDNNTVKNVAAQPMNTDKTLMEETEDDFVLEWDDWGKNDEERCADDELAKEYFRIKMEEQKKSLNIIGEDEKIVLNKDDSRSRVRKMSKLHLDKPDMLKTSYRNEEPDAQSVRPGSPVLDRLLLHLDTLNAPTTKEVCDNSVITTRDKMSDQNEEAFSFDKQVSLSSHPGPSPSVILQGLTMSNANDGINLERLETIGDSFLKHAITAYLYCTYPNIHEGKLSYLRSKQVSNLNLYRLGKKKGLGECMIATKFEPNDNWLPPGYFVPKELEQALIDSGIPAGHWNIAHLPDLKDWKDLDAEQIRKALVKDDTDEMETPNVTECNNVVVVVEDLKVENGENQNGETEGGLMCFIPYNLMTQHSIPDKSIADCVEALIGAYLTSCGPRGALLFMSWLGIKVLPQVSHETIPEFGFLKAPPSPLLRIMPNAELELDILLDGYDRFEEKIGYCFRDRSYLLQSFTHASYHYNRLTDCYQRLEFLGDAVLDYLITRHLYEDPRQHSPGALTDLRSALVNNTIFATLAVKHDFHKYFKAICPGLFVVIDKFVQMQKENNHKLNEEVKINFNYYFIEEDECEEAEDIEVPKALGDVFESVAGAIYLDSNMSLDTVWRVYYNMMKSEIEQFMTNVPKSPIRELLEMEPETAKFGIPEKTLDGKVRVTVEIFGKGKFRGLGRNYRIAKCTAAKHALKALKKLQGFHS